MTQQTPEKHTSSVWAPHEMANRYARHPDGVHLVPVITVRNQNRAYEIKGHRPSTQYLFASEAGLRLFSFGATNGRRDRAQDYMQYSILGQPGNIWVVGVEPKTMKTSDSLKVRGCDYMKVFGMEDIDTRFRSDTEGVTLNVPQITWSSLNIEEFSDSDLRELGVVAEVVLAVQSYAAARRGESGPQLGSAALQG